MEMESNGNIPRRFQRSGSQICPTPEEELLRAILNNEELKIKRFLKDYPHLLHHRYEEQFNNTPLLIACSKDDIKAETVKAILDMGANKTETNFEDWTALHCAAKKTHYRTLEALLKKDSEDIINIPSGGLNALHVLIRFGKPESNDFLRCAELLINKGINLNHGDKNNRTPLFWAKKKKQDDTVNIIENALNSPQRTSEYSTSDDKEILIKYLKEGHEEDFMNSGVNIKDLVDETDSESTLLQICCDKGLPRAAKHLLLEGADVNRTYRNEKRPIELATSHGFTEILKILLEHDAVVTTEIFCICLRDIDSTTHDYEGCYHELMKNIKTKIPDEQLLILNGKDRNYTPLHYAVRYADSSIVQELLSLGASLGSKNIGGVMPIEDLEPKILEKHLDNCVKFNEKDKNCDKENFQVTFDYRSLIPPYIKVSPYSTETDDKLFIMNKLKNDPEAGNLKKVLVGETEVIFYMSNSAEFKHLLKHPVIASFLFMKWRRIQFLFWTNFYFYAAFLCSLIFYIFTDYAYLSSNDRSAFIKFVSQISYGILFVTLIILFLRELFQIIIAPKKYVKSFENYVEIILIVITSVIVFCHSSYDTRKQLASVAILLAAFELVLILGQHPYFSTNVVMLKTVSFNFFKFLGWYSILLIAFALSFYLLFTPSQTNGEEANVIDVVNKRNESSESEKEEDTFFDNPYRSVFKTVIMLTGEFDAGSINFNAFPITSKIVFTLFIFMIAIILLNLLNGLAVSDTQMIKNDAELVGYIIRARHLQYVESMLLGNIIPVNLMEKLANFCCCFPSTEISHWSIGRFIAENACLFPKYLNYELVLYPNRHGCVELYSKKQNSSAKCFSCSGVFLDRDTVRRTRNIIQARKDDGGNDLAKMSEEIKTLKEKLDRILNILKP